MNTVLLFVIGLSSGLLASHLLELSLKKNKFFNRNFFRRHTIIFGYHIHHSTYGLGALVIGTTLLARGIITSAIFFIAMGVGIIMMHTIFDGRLIFIEKEIPKTR